MYERAAKVAKEKGESAKVRRYNRAVDSIKTMQKQVSETIVWMSGSPVTSLSLPLSPSLPPPPGASRQGGQRG